MQQNSVVGHYRANVNGTKAVYGAHTSRTCSIIPVRLDENTVSVTALSDVRLRS